MCDLTHYVYLVDVFPEDDEGEALPAVMAFVTGHGHEGMSVQEIAYQTGFNVGIARVTGPIMVLPARDNA